MWNFLCDCMLNFNLLLEQNQTRKPASSNQENHINNDPSSMALQNSLHLL